MAVLYSAGQQTSGSLGRKLSVAMIVRDAEPTIAAALESVRAMADEIVVIDTGSTDRTREIARQRATKLLHWRWDDDFSSARNFALQHVTGDWVLWLDSNETLAPEAAAAIRAQIDAAPQANAAYLLLVQLATPVDQTEAEQIGRARLWPTRAQLRYTGRLRESLEPTLAAAGLAIETTTWRIFRAPGDAEPSRQLAKAQRDLRIAELEMADNGERPALQLACGDACAALNEPLKAAGWYRRAIDDAEPASTEMLEGYYGLLTTLDRRPEAREEQLATCLEALDIFPLDAQLLCAMGSYLQGQGRLDLAARSYQMAVEHGQINLQAAHLVHLADVATACLAMTLDLLDRGGEAIQVLHGALAARGNSPRLLRQLLELHIKRNRRQAALEVLDLLPGEARDRETMRTVVRGACLAAERQWLAAISYLQGAYEAGCRDSICLRWLAQALAGSGNTGEAEKLLIDWIASDGQHPEARRLLQQLVQSARLTSGALAGDPLAPNAATSEATASHVPAPHIGIVGAAVNASGKRR